MDTKTFDTFRGIIYETSGISINSSKIALVTARVGKRMRELGIADYGAYLRHVRDDETGEEMVRLLDCISTNVTSFFRERDHFDYLAKLAKGWMDAGRTKIRIWCAAASTGEEPYTIAMTLKAVEETRHADIRILATDISTRVLQACGHGVYTEKQAAGISEGLRKRFFNRIQTAGGNDTKYEAKDELKSMITFTRLNLSQPPFPMNGPFDAIFVRNVMIYFDDVVRKRLLDECCRLLRPDGYIFVGHAETLASLLSNLKTVSPSVYVKT
jgi:chemotaxis protein methyltransferase CheR